VTSDGVSTRAFAHEPPTVASKKANKHGFIGVTFASRPQRTPLRTSGFE
jgi:hypothetical protein